MKKGIVLSGELIMATFIQPIGNAPCDIMLIGDVPSKRDLENGYALSGYSALDFSSDVRGGTTEK